MTQRHFASLIPTLCQCLLLNTGKMHVMLFLIHYRKRSNKNKMKKKAVLPLTHRKTFVGVFAFQADCAFTIIWWPNSRSKLIYFNSLFNINVCTNVCSLQRKVSLLSVRLTTSSCVFVWHLGSGHRSRDSKKDQQMHMDKTLLFLGLCDPESSLSYTSVGWGLPLLPTALTSFSLPMYWYTTAACYWLSLIIWFVLVTLCCPLFSSLLPDIALLNHSSC